jgi:hypothetical protein
MAKRLSAKTKKRPTKKAKLKQPEAVKTRPAAKPEPAFKPSGWQKFFRPADVQVGYVSSSWSITRATINLAWQHKKIFGGLVIAYALLSIILVRGFSGGVDASALKHDLSSLFTGSWGALATNFSVLNSLVSSSNTAASGASGTYQLFVVLIVSLATIWALRAVKAGESFRLRDTFYKGMAPLIPFLLVLCVIGLQLIPFLLGATIYAIATSYGIAANFMQILPWLILLILMAVWSFYMIISSIFALYISTLPDMTPLKALRSARELVRYRRWSLLRKLLFLPLALLIITVIIMIPIIWLVPVLAQWVFLLLSFIALILAHIYLYTLYRDLLT